MSAGLKKTIVTAGDSEINVITALGELKYLTSCLGKSMFHLNEYVNDNLEPNLHKTVIQKQVQLLSRSIDFLEEKVGFITTQQGVTTLSDRSHTRKRAAENRQMKRDEKMNVRKSNNYISPVDNLLASLVETSFPKKISIATKCRYQTSRKKEEGPYYYCSKRW